MKKKLILLLALILIFIGITAAYTVTARKDIARKTHAFLEANGYTQDDISSVEIKHSFVNKLLGYNEWRIFVVLECEPDIYFAFTYRNEEIIRQGVAGRNPLDNDKIVEYENKFDHGELHTIR